MPLAPVDTQSLTDRKTLSGIDSGDWTMMVSSVKSAGIEHSLVTFSDWQQLQG
jgi:hypothetical protein